MTDNRITEWRKLAKGPSDYDDRIWLESCCDALSNACDRIEAFEIRLKAMEAKVQQARERLGPDYLGETLEKLEKVGSAMTSALARCAMYRGELFRIEKDLSDVSEPKSRSILYKLQGFLVAPDDAADEMLRNLSANQKMIEIATTLAKQRMEDES